MKTLQERFEDKYYKEPDDGCWLWEGCVLNSGYGQIRVGRKMKSAHRVSYELYVGPIPEAMHMCHSCDVKSCVRPSHLFPGTDQENTDDMMAKGRVAKGSDAGAAKLTEDEALGIFHDKRLFRVIAADYGIHPTTVGFLKNKRTWKHIHEATA